MPVAEAVSAKAAILIDEVSGKVLWAKDPDLKRAPASTTKIMTALLLIERCRPEEVIVAPPDIEKVGEASLHLKPGERVSVRDMLYGIMLRSANDGCVAAAIHCAGSVEAFVTLMNERARQLGCLNTTFVNPNGLTAEGHVTTARDLALIAREAMRYPEFRALVRERKQTIERSINTADRQLISRNKWLDLDKTADGIKTGFTRPAGLCFVGSASRGGYRMISVVLGSDNWVEDTSRIINWGFAHHEVSRPITAGQALETPAPLSSGGTVPAGPVRSARYVALKGLPAAHLEPVFLPNLRAPIARGQVVGALHLTDPDGWKDVVPLVALESVAAPAVGTSTRWPYVLGGGVLGALYLLGRRRRSQFYGRIIAS